MSVPLGEIELPNRETGSTEVGEICRGLSAQDLDDFDSEWWPVLKERRSELIDQLSKGSITQDEFHATFVRLSLQDHHWDWANKFAHYGANPNAEFFAVHVEGRTQGLMMTADGKTSLRPEDAGKGLTYIEYLAVAPWNRKGFFATQKLGHVGSVLMATAISESIDRNYGGCIGLHSLPQADDFYRKCGMVDLGPDSAKDDLLYFEMSAAKATEFLEGI